MDLTATTTEPRREKETLARMIASLVRRPSKSRDESRPGRKLMSAAERWEVSARMTKYRAERSKAQI
jgi:hypothetical protein